MKVLVVLYIFECLIAYSTADQRCDNFKLELVQVLFRHGARTPNKIELDAFNDTDISAYEPWGLGELTDRGKQQEYDFGSFLRERYANYLRSTYKTEDVYAYTSDASRTKMSLLLVLAGLYPSVDRAKTNKYLNWNPIPYVSAPSRLDILLMAYINPKVMKLFVEFINSDIYKNQVAKYSQFFDFIAENTGRNSSIFNTVLTFGVLMSHEYMNFSLPHWYQPNVRQTYMELIDLVGDFITYTTEMKKLAIGPLIKTFIDNVNLDGKVHNPRKIYLYGGHDVNILMFARAHNIQEFHYPLFGSALIFEKLRDLQTNQTYVRIFAWDGLGQITALKLNGTEECLSTDNYLEIVNPIIPSEKDIDDMIGSFNSTEIRNLFFNNTANSVV